MSDDLAALRVDLTKAAAKALPELRAIFQDAASEIKDKWRANARTTAGKHGKLYPNSITYETRLLAEGIYAEIGPDSSYPQGGMSFEMGSAKQPPHLDGQKAADAVVPQIERRLHSIVAFLGL